LKIAITATRYGLVRLRGGLADVDEVSVGRALDAADWKARSLYIFRGGAPRKSHEALASGPA